MTRQCLNVLVSYLLEDSFPLGAPVGLAENPFDPYEKNLWLGFEPMKV